MTCSSRFGIWLVRGKERDKGRKREEEKRKRDEERRKTEGWQTELAQGTVVW